MFVSAAGRMRKYGTVKREKGESDEVEKEIFLKSILNVES
jgi:hypothetical protein